MKEEQSDKKFSISDADREHFWKLKIILQVKALYRDNFVIFLIP